MYLKIVLRHLKPERAQDNCTLHYKDGLSKVSFADAQEILANLDLKSNYVKEIRFQYMFDKNVMVGLLVSVIC